MSEKDTQNRINRWNEILDEVVSDTFTLTTDLKEGVKYMGWYAVGNVASAILLFNLIIVGQDNGPIYIGLLVFGLFTYIWLCIASGRKYLNLRVKYDRIFKLQEELSVS